jgi:hypothetical protein
LCCAAEWKATKRIAWKRSRWTRSFDTATNKKRMENRGQDGDRVRLGQNENCC